MKDKVTVAGYCRVSTEGQAEETKVSLGAQKRAITQQAKSAGWELFAIYEDHESGTKETRTNYLRMKSDAADGHFKKVVFLAWDRFGRSAREILNAHKEFEDLGVGLYCCQAAIDTSTPEGKLLMTNMAGFAEFDHSNLTRRMLAGRYHAARKGTAIAGRLPYGYMWEEGEGIVLVEEEAKMLRRMFGLYLAHNSIRQVVEALNKEGYRTRHGKVWQHSSITRILGNEHYCGQMVLFANRAEPARVPCPQIISHAEHKKVKALMIENNTRRDLYPRNVKADDPYLLRGLLRCGVCGSKMQAGKDGGNGPRAYMCLWSKHKHLTKEMAYEHKKPCTLPVVKAEKLEHNMLSRITFMLLRPSKILELLQGEDVDTKALDKKLAVIQVRITKAQAAYDHLYDLFAVGQIPQSELIRKLNQQRAVVSELEAQRADVTTRIELAQGKVKQALDVKRDAEGLVIEGVGRVHEVLERANNAELKQFLRATIVDRLTVQPDGGARGDYDFGKAYEWLANFKTTLKKEYG